MAKKYKNLKQLAAAFASGELDRKQYKLILDNDSSHLSWCGPLPVGMKKDSDAADAYMDEMDDKAGAMYRGNGYADLQEACEAAGIPCEWC